MNRGFGALESTCRGPASSENTVISRFQLAKERLWAEEDRDSYPTIVSLMRDSSISMVFVRSQGECNLGLEHQAAKTYTPAN
jgi:hypothetical protein